MKPSFFSSTPSTPPQLLQTQLYQDEKHLFFHSFFGAINTSSPSCAVRGGGEMKKRKCKRGVREILLYVSQGARKSCNYNVGGFGLRLFPSCVLICGSVRSVSFFSDGRPLKRPLSSRFHLSVNTSERDREGNLAFIRLTMPWQLLVVCDPEKMHSFSNVQNSNLISDLWCDVDLTLCIDVKRSATEKGFLFCCTHSWSIFFTLLFFLNI